MDTLSKVKEKTVYKSRLANRQVKLAYSYATHLHNSLKYTKFVYDVAEAKYSDQVVKLVVYDSNTDHVESYLKGKPSNVELVVLHRRPLALGFGLVAHANLPILMTGDFGPTIALEYEKPFFMETHPHKVEFRDSLKKKFGRYLRGKNAYVTGLAMDFDKIEIEDSSIMFADEYWEKFL